MQQLIDWIQARLADTQLVMLLVSLLVIFGLLMVFADILAPLLVALAFAYVLDGVVSLLVRLRMPMMPAVLLVCFGALLMVLFALLTVLPLLSDQVGRLISQVPEYMQSLRDILHTFQEHYASWLNPNYVQQMLGSTAMKIQEWGGVVLKFSLASIPGLIALLVYAVLVPVLVFFLLKDKDKLIVWSTQFLPREHVLLRRVWDEVDVQIGNYIRGRFWESLVIGGSMGLVFWLMGHEYALLLGTLTGISVWVPFIGAAVVTVPVVLLSFFQWGWSEMTAYSILAYAIIQAIDANVLIPWLFSEMVNLHPIAIIVAVLVFGSLWGVVGVFIAIPMAALIHSVLVIIRERSKQPEVPSPADG
jgi:putative permease